MIEVLVASLCFQILGLFTPIMMQVVIDKVLVHNSLTTLDVLTIGLAGILIFELVMGIAKNYVFCNTTNKMDVILSAKLFNHLLRLPLRYFETRRVGDTVARVKELENIRRFLTGTPLTSLLDVVFISVYLVVMLFYSSKLTAIVVISIPFFIALSAIATPLFRHRLDEKFNTGAEAQSYLVEAVTGINTIKSLALEPTSQRKWESLQANYTNAGFKASILSGNIGSAGQFIQKAFDLAILWYGAHLVIDRQISVGQLVAFRMLASRVSGPILRLVQIWQDYQQTVISVKRIGDIFNTKHEIASNSSKTRLPDINGNISFQDVSFVKVVQAFEEGVVTGIYVEDGENVKQGQLLMDLDTSMKDLDNTTYNKLLSNVVLEREVLQCIVDGTNYNQIADKYEHYDDKAYILEYYNSVLSDSDAKREVLKSQLDQSKANLKLAEEEKIRLEDNISYVQTNIDNLNIVMQNKSAAEEQLDLLSVNITNLKEEEQKLNNLFKSGVIPENEWRTKKNELDMAEAEYSVKNKNIESDESGNKDRMVELENQLSEYSNAVNAQNANIELAKAEIKEIENNIANFHTNERKNYLDQIVKKDVEITEYKAAIEKNQKSMDYGHIYATADGEIYGMALNTIGEVAKPAESIMTIVPDGTELIVETLLLNKDIGYVEMGQEVIVKVDTYPFQKFGTIKGEVIGISPNAYYDENYGNVYKIKVRLTDNKLTLNGKEYNILSGMEVSAEIKTGERRIIEFFLEPFVKYVDESIKLR